MAALSREPRHVDDVARDSGLAAGEVSATLALLELKGLVRDLGGMQFVRVRDEAAGYGGSGDGDQLTGRASGTSDPGPGSEGSR
jgi:DNA processing protein